jgi:hypothetical protein
LAGFQLIMYGRFWVITEGLLKPIFFTLTLMSPAQMRDNFEKRLALANAKAEPGLIDSLLDDAGTEPGNLALLEHALTKRTLAPTRGRWPQIDRCRLCPDRTIARRPRSTR